MSENWIAVHLRKGTLKKVAEAARTRDESKSDFVERATVNELARLGLQKRRAGKISHRPCPTSEIIEASDVQEFGMRILQHLRVSPALGSLIELQHLSDGSIRVGQLK